MSAAVWLPDVLSDAFRGVRGFQVDAVKGWRTRSAKSTTFEPRGVMNHHTGKGSYANLLTFMTTGSSLAPLCNLATSRPHPIGGIDTVRITVCAAGRANHAGKGDLRFTGRDNGNRHTIGIENQNDGKQSWPGQQVEGIRIATAAILKHLGADADFMVDHMTYAPGRKVDRHSVDLPKERLAVKALIDKPVPSDGERTHTVRAGDTPFGIAQRFGVDVEELMRLNRIIDPTKLQIGQVLKIPRR